MELMTCIKQKHCYNATLHDKLLSRNALYVGNFRKRLCSINFGASSELKPSRISMRIWLMMTHAPVRMALVPMHFARTIDDILRLHGQLLDRSYLRQLAVKSVRVFHRLSPSHPRARIRMLSHDKMHLARPEQLAENDGPELPR